MYLTRKTALILYRRMLVVWISVFAFGLIEGCLAHAGAASAAFSVLAVPAATISEVDHGDSGTARDIVCKQFCLDVASASKHEQSTAILSSNVFLLRWVTLSLLTMTMVSGAKPISHRSSGTAASITHPYLLFQRFNN